MMDGADKSETVAPRLIIKRLKAALPNRPGRNGNHVGKFLEQKMALFGSLHSQCPFPAHYVAFLSMVRIFIIRLHNSYACNTLLFHLAYYLPCLLFNTLVLLN
jgi:hypothetical protein